ncbi:hypothetical protein [Weissella confusa]|uniref:hypothetical protein n=1 Tax=Weissella confusa TaxID=1583 RepID=UPI002164B629|nr:hypothetical protein [Weissella confusa]
MTNKNLIAKQELSHPADWKPEAAHADVRAQIEDAIAKRLTEIIATVADFGFESATVNLHDLQDFVRDVVFVTTNSISARTLLCVNNLFWQTKCHFQFSTRSFKAASLIFWITQISNTHSTLTVKFKFSGTKLKKA